MKPWFVAEGSPPAVLFAKPWLQGAGGGGDHGGGGGAAEESPPAVLPPPEAVFPFSCPPEEGVVV